MRDETNTEIRPKARHDLSDSLGPRFSSLVFRMSWSQNRCTLLRDML
jgi:hypothetical protein